MHLNLQLWHKNVQTRIPARKEKEPGLRQHESTKCLFQPEKLLEGLKLNWNILKFKVKALPIMTITDQLSVMT